MSSRRIVCFFPSASSSSIEVFVSPASRPLRTRPSVVETVYWRKFPSTDRLGSRMWTSSSLFGCAAMPVRSGPTLPPSPECVWHLAHSFLKTSLPRAASPPFRTIGDSASITFWRSGSGRPPPWRAGPWPARRSCCRGGRPGPASGRARGGTAPPSPSRSRSSSALVQSVFAEQRQDARPAGRRGHRPERVDQRRADLGRLAPGHGADQAAREVGRRPRRDQGEEVARGLRVGLAEVDQLPGGVDAGGLGLRRVGGRGEEVPRRSRRRTASSPLTPQREARPSIWPRASGESFGRSAAMAFSASASSFGGLVAAASPSARPAMMASRTVGLHVALEAPGPRRSSRPARPARSARRPAR